jgi:hypothetical protein
MLMGMTLFVDHSDAERQLAQRLEYLSAVAATP